MHLRELALAAGPCLRAASGSPQMEIEAISIHRNQQFVHEAISKAGEKYTCRLGQIETLGRARDLQSV